VSFAALADAGWPALECAEAGGWRARFSSGVTKRANSAWAADAGAEVSAAALEAVERRYRSRGLPPLFQLARDDEAALRLLVGRGYTAIDETLVMAGAVATAGADPAVTITDEPDDEWLDVWWTVDGRGGPAERAVARSILTGVPSLYAALRVGGRAVAVARLALVGSWGGLYCVATLPEARRQGFGGRVVRAVLAAGASVGVRDAWLQVLARNSAAIALYEELGFRAVDRYRYLLGAARPLPAAYCR
jgi:ribosomal protein S18 acetylase RimI-like enzyme